ncbi:TonB-dependent receptor [Hymenobacter sp. BT186]|uniref:TonB-dependent receptor n=1 Tax=Hymenobacter telluris TaxID=2816474 RepID=A0A939JDA6_9BACT|nr:TonB-dependent receptor [Hymenobacter telluris]MBO0358708.1 TonB-dependent receptor [Hymenobacter telluris]MBW3374734.1 TonB-dependent receptor [Hymenobacter norwichensis]
MNKTLLMSPILMVGLLQQVSAQTRTISGRVTDRQSGDGLPGVTVLLKGTTNGVSTNSDGTYTLNVPTTGGTLVFSSVGFVQQERAIGTETQINIGLGADTKALSEVVVTGYGGSQDVKDITGSVAQVKEEKLLLQPVQSVDQALQGRMAGVNVNTTSGTLGDQAAVRIRGANSISGSSQPLYVLDGVPLNTTEQGNVLSTRYNPLADINPNDIQSVDVLKDASAAAIYGSRASNGVIVITTKRGRSGQNRVSINSFYGFQQAIRKPNMLNAADFTTISNEKAYNSRFGSSNGVINTTFPIDIAKPVDVNGDGVNDETNWINEIFQNGTQQNYQAALSGGNEFASYYGSGDWNDQKGIILKNRLRRGSGRLNIDLTPKKWLKAGVSLNYSKSYNQGINGETALAGATVSGYTAPPNVPVYNPDGTYYLNSLGNLGNGNNAIPNAAISPNAYYHIPATLNLNKNDNTSQRILGNGYLTVEPIKGLQFTTKYGIDYNTNFEEQYSSGILGGLGRNALGAGQLGLVQDYNTDRAQFNWQNYVNYDRTFADKHTVGVTGGVEYQETKTRRIYTVAGGFSDDKFQSIIDNVFTSQAPGGGQLFNVGFQSYFGRVNYNFGSKYYASFSLRSDASSVFGVNNQRGTFPGGSIGWRISEESFMQGIKVVNDLKLRASYGSVGNSNGLGSYAARTLIGGGLYADVNGFTPTQIGNPDLQWEKSNKLDIGLDASLLNNRLNVVFDFFNNDISDLLLAAPTLRTTGIPGSSINRNIGSMYNRGVELTLNTTNVQLENGFTWTSSINGSVIKNRVTALSTPNDIISANQRASIGRSLGVYYLPEWAGVNPANGNAQFYDKDGNIKQYDAAYAVATSSGFTVGRWLNADGEPTTGIGAADFKYTKKTGYPKFFGGFDNTFAYKGIELGIFLQYSGGNYVYNGYRQALLSSSFQNNIDEIKDRWTTPGQETEIQKLVLRDPQSNQASTRWLEKGDFLRLRQVSLGYNLAQPLVKRLGLNNVRIYGLVQNAYTFTKYKGLDPEVNTNITGNIAYGVDGRSVPPQRSFTLGINLGI